MLSVPLGTFFILECRYIKTPWRRRRKRRTRMKRRQLWMQYPNNEVNPPELRCPDEAACVIKEESEIEKQIFLI